MRLLAKRLLLSRPPLQPKAASKIMFSGLIDWSAKNRFLIVMLALILLVWGGATVAESEMDVLPEFAPPQVVIETEAPGLVAQEVETLVSLPLEAAMNGTPGVTLVKSISQNGVSMITVIFRYGTDIYTARQLVNEKIQTVMPRLPHAVQPPSMLPVMSTVGDILKIGLSSDTLSPMELRTLADWTIRNRLLAVPGVSRVYVIGGDEKQYQVLVQPEQLRSFGVSLDQVRRAVERANVVAPAGFMVSRDRQLPIQALGRVQNLSDIGNSVVTTRQGVPVLVRHVAKVAIAPAFKVGDAMINGQPGVELVVSRQPWCNTLDVTKRVQSALAEVRRALPSEVKIVTIFRQASFIERSIDNVLWAIATGGVLVVAVLLLFLFNWRTALISLTAIPLSLLSAVLIIKAFGGSVNVMTLGGLAIAVGEVVDDAIVDVENVYRRLRENRLQGSPKSALRVVIDGCREVRSSVIYATFIVALVFLPVFTLTGTEGRIFSPLGYAYVTATLSSLVVALTLTPALCMYLLPNSVGSKEPPVVTMVKSTYGRLVQTVLAFPRLVVLGAVVMFVAVLTLVPIMGQEFLPEFKEEALIIACLGLPGQSLEATTRMGMAVEQRLMQHTDISAIGQRAGRTEQDDDAGGPNFSEFDVQLKPTNRSLSSIIADIRKHLNDVPGITFDVGSFIQHRMEDVLSGGTRAQIAIKIFGPDLNTLRALADDVASTLKAVPGAVDVRPEPLVMVPEITVHINRDRAARYGITAEDLSRNLETAFQGVVVSQVLDNQKLFALRVTLGEQFRDSIDEIRDLLVDTPDGTLIPLSQVADVTLANSPNAVVRENVTRRIVVQANTEGRDVVSVVNDAKRRIGKITMPQGYFVEYAGEYAAQKEASQRLFAMGALALLGILAFLRQGLRSWRSALLVAVNLPLATIGGIIAVALTGNVVSIGSLIGFISLFGISTRNSLLLVTHINHLEDEGVPQQQAIYRGCLDRVCPVLMTALTAALGMLPLAVWGGAGRELEQPLAVVVVGGLVSSTALTLLVIPALFKMFSLSSGKPMAPVESPADASHVSHS
jgi:CzcA family heavy metal efflux pump